MLEVLHEILGPRELKAGLRRDYIHGAGVLIVTNVINSPQLKDRDDQSDKPN